MQDPKTQPNGDCRRIKKQMTNIAKTDIDIDVKDRDVLLEKLKHILVLSKTVK